jgi:hypothetical protein
MRERCHLNALGILPMEIAAQVFRVEEREMGWHGVLRTVKIFLVKLLNHAINDKSKRCG